MNGRSAKLLNRYASKLYADAMRQQKGAPLIRHDLDFAKVTRSVGYRKLRAWWLQLTAKGKASARRRIQRELAA